jgi:hypothetical protein
VQAKYACVCADANSTHLSTRIQIALPLVVTNAIFGVGGTKSGACSGGLRVNACASVSVCGVCVGKKTRQEQEEQGEKVGRGRREKRRREKRNMNSIYDYWHVRLWTKYKKNSYVTDKHKTLDRNTMTLNEKPNTWKRAKHARFVLRWFSATSSAIRCQQCARIAKTRARYAIYSLVGVNAEEDDEWEDGWADDDGRADETGRAGVENDEDEEEDDDKDDDDDEDDDEDDGSSECAILSGAHTIAHRLKSSASFASEDEAVAWRSPSTMRNAERSVSAACHSAVSVQRSWW